MYRVLFQGDRHACARDDTVFFTVFARKRSDEASPGRVISCAFYPLSSALPTLPPKEEAKVCLLVSNYAQGAGCQGISPTVPPELVSVTVTVHS